MCRLRGFTIIRLVCLFGFLFGGITATDAGGISHPGRELTRLPSVPARQDQEDQQNQEVEPAEAGDTANEPDSGESESGDAGSGETQEEAADAETLVRPHVSIVQSEYRLVPAFRDTLSSARIAVADRGPRETVRRQPGLCSNGEVVRVDAPLDQHVPQSQRFGIRAGFGIVHHDADQGPRRLVIPAMESDPVKWRRASGV